MEKLQSPFAVMDLGTNTFHLLIARMNKGEIQFLHKEKVFVKLASGGIDHISEEKMALGLSTLSKYKNKIEEFGVDNIRVCGTEGLRKANNADEFIDKVRNQLGLSIEVINGDREAELIHKGVSQCIALNHKNSLIMDIGGGSTEFIIANAEQVLWTLSLPLGASVLKNNYHVQEPFSPESYKGMMLSLERALKDVFQAIDEYNVIDLIGASGSFDSIVSMLKANSSLYPSLHSNCDIIELDAYRVIHLQLLKSTYNERLEMDGLLKERAEAIVVASCLISLILGKLHQSSFLVSQYALKEGLLTEIKNGVAAEV